MTAGHKLPLFSLTYVMMTDMDIMQRVKHTNWYKTGVVSFPYKPKNIKGQCHTAQRKPETRAIPVKGISLDNSGTSNPRHPSSSPNTDGRSKIKLTVAVSRKWNTITAVFDQAPKL